MNDEYILRIKDLNINFNTDEGIVRAVNGVNLDVKKGQSVGIVGESGCGKSVTSYSILRLLPKTADITSGTINYQRDDGYIDLLQLKQHGSKMREIRGAEIAMIFQEPMTAFSPVHTIANQVTEVIIHHKGVSKEEARQEAIELLAKVGIPKPEQRIDEYPFQYSGGMRQRAMIAMALACNPKLLIADEPTTALDVTIQAQVLKVIKEMQDAFNLSMILITHDLGVIAHMVDYVYIMYLGRVVESGSVKDIFNNPLHPYTKDLLKSIPKITGTSDKLASIEGSVPDSYSLPSGCSFHPRCQYVVGPECENQIPPFIEMEPGHFVSCFLHQ